MSTATAGAMVHSGQRARAMSMVTFVLSLGTVAGVPVGMLLGERFSWRITLGLVVVLGVLSMFALAVRASGLPRLDRPANGPSFAVLRVPTTAAGVAAGFLLGVASLGLYTYLLPMADSVGLANWGFGLVWVWGIGGVAASALVGHPLDGYGPRVFLIVLPALLAASFALVWITSSPAAWLVAAAVWGGAGWSSVPTLQHALTADAPADAMPIIAFQMAAIYLGSAVGAALGSSLLAGGTRAADLAGWALIPALGALALTGWIASRTPGPRA